MTRGFFPLLALVIAAGTAALSFETDGFRVVTGAGARQLAIEQQPQLVADAKLVDQNGVAFLLSDYRGQPLLVDFIYTRCPSVCSALGDDLHRVLNIINRADTAVPINLLSISFDRDHDDRTALAAYAEAHGAEAPQWRIAVPADDSALATLIRSFDVVVIPDGIGGFVHNGAVYVVDTRGRLARILDPDAPPQQLAKALRGTVP